MKTYDLSTIADTVIQNKGLFGIFGRPMSGKSTLLMYITHKISQCCDSNLLILSVEMYEPLWREKSRSLNMTYNDSTCISDCFVASVGKLEKIIKDNKFSFVAIDYLQISSFNLKDLKELSERLDITIIITGQIPRSVGNFELGNYPEHLSECDHIIYQERKPIFPSETREGCDNDYKLSVKKNNFGELCEVDFNIGSMGEMKKYA